MSLPDRYAPLDDAHLRIAEEQERQPDRNPYVALDAAHKRISQEQEIERAKQVEREPKDNVAPDNPPSASAQKDEAPAPQNEYYKTLNREHQTSEGIVQALLDGDEPRIAEIRQDMLDRGYKGFEINNEINKADAIAQNRLAQSSSQEITDARASTVENEQTDRSQNISDRDARRQQFLAERQGQRHDLDKGDDLSLD